MVPSLLHCKIILYYKKNYIFSIFELIHILSLVNGKLRVFIGKKGRELIASNRLFNQTVSNCDSPYLLIEVIIFKMYQNPY